MPAKCVSSVSPRFPYRRLAFCFLPLAAILEFLFCFRVGVRPKAMATVMISVRVRDKNSAKTRISVRVRFRDRTMFRVMVRIRITLRIWEGLG
jgi:hypothetical protein